MRSSAWSQMMRDSLETSAVSRSLDSDGVIAANAALAKGSATSRSATAGLRGRSRSQRTTSSMMVGDPGAPTAAGAELEDATAGLRGRSRS